MVILGGLEIIIGGYIIHKVLERRRRRREELGNATLQNSSNPAISASSDPVRSEVHDSTHFRNPNRKSSSNHPHEPIVPNYSEAPLDRAPIVCFALLWM